MSQIKFYNMIKKTINHCNKIKILNSLTKAKI